MKTNLRLAVLDDAIKIADIHARSWLFAYSDIIPVNVIENQNKKWPEIWNKMLANNENSHYIIEVDSVAIGFLTISASRDKDLKELFYEVVGLYLDPDFIGKGYGKAAMSFITKQVKQRGYNHISLWVLEDNARARKFYEGVGFSFDGNIKPSGLSDTREVRYIMQI